MQPNDDWRDAALAVLKNKTALVFCGGGVLGAAECEALIALEELGVSLSGFKLVTGSSIGSFLATVVACGGKTTYMKELLDTINFADFQDHSCLLTKSVHLLSKYGLNKVTGVKQLAIKVLTDLVGDANITFKELFDKTGVRLVITYFSLNHQQTMYADYESEPDAKVQDAIIKSSSIPVFYEAFFEGGPRKSNKLVSCDGGTANNYPMDVPRKHGFAPINILGIKLIPSKDFDHVENGGTGALVNHGPPTGAVNYFTTIINVLRRQAMRMHVSEGDWRLTVRIDVGQLTSTSFEMSAEQKLWLRNQGKLAVTKYFAELQSALANGVEFV
jgi:NTE family protein